MASEDRQLRDALEKAQAALRTTRAELERAQAEQAKLDRTEEELETTRRELAEAQERERELAEALEASKRESRPPVEFEVPPAPPARIIFRGTREFGGAATEYQTTEPPKLEQPAGVEFGGAAERSAFGKLSKIEDAIPAYKTAQPLREAAPNSGDPRMVVIGFGGVLLIGGGILALMAEAPLLGLAMIVVGLTVAIGALNH